ncbi:SDR family NAD(P)-dependent oxidoreductase [Acanthopleuribacter pedis]|uniref:SDR family NAD(P)-dependent oxidoreductase n=1 Tax=Acanthopleuribacter pedis TaxID=442870 RepID=A0A8J7U3Z6_9BACT|nr:SDR family NAD(P)-dependent oxidoreductase [Acanthopleuribacter pedis]MBO1317796.1 SDR family NAD(P)-dependent oxidoreductase [Acanthopleuribacter pedis]
MNKAHLELIYRKFQQGSLTKAEAMQLIEAAAAAPDCRLHPLVHHNVSTLNEIAFSSRFEGDEFFLRDHRVRERRILPGAAYIEVARVAAALALPAPDETACALLRQVTWTAPLAVESPTDVKVTLAEQEPGVLRYQITTGAEAGDVVVHGGGLVQWQTQVARPVLDLEGLRREIQTRRLDGETCYRRFEALGIVYGPMHRALRAVWVAGNQVLAQLALDAEPASLAAYGVHPALLDAAQQAAVALLAEGDAGRPSLPFAVNEVKVYGPCETTMWAWLRPAADGRKRDIDLCDAAGRVCVRLQGLAAREMDPPENTPAETLLLTAPAWQVQHPPTTAAPVPTPWLVGGTPAQQAALQAVFPEAGVLEVAGDVPVSHICTQLQQNEPIEHIVWFAPAGAAVGPAMLAAQNGGVFNLFRLIQALLQNGAGALHLTVVTQQVLAVGDEAVDATHAAVHGLVGSLAKEVPDWRIRLCDIAAADGAAFATLFRMPADPEGNAWVVRGQQWWRRELLPLDVPAESAPTPHRARGTYVVIGGAGGLGRVWSQRLAAETGAQTVWIGRRPLDEKITAALDEVAAVGPRPLYLQADASDGESLAQARARIHAAFGPIHGVVHAALVLDDRALVNMPEAVFRAALTAKLDVGVTMARVFGDEPLDFLLFFSSLNAYQTSPGQANYAAACTAKDALAVQLGQTLSCTVKVMNWGYWGGVGRVADPFYQQRMARAGIASIEPDEGWAALEQLLQLPVPCAALAKVTGPAATPPPERWMLIPAGADADYAAVTASLQQAPPETALLLLEAWLETAARLEHQLAPLLWDSLNRLDLLDADRVPAVGAWFGDWLVESRRLLAQHALHDRPEDREAPWRRWSQGVAAAAPDQAARLRLVDTCLRALPDVLAGRKPATEVLFPNGSTELVEAVYKGNDSANLFNETAAKAAVAVAEARRGRAPGAKLRILEIGAGTGGTTAAILARLQPLGDAVAEYTYTDISKAFLMHGEARFTAEAPFLRTALFDVTRDPAAQGIAVGGYDLVVATNVLHATPDMRTTLRHTKAVLRRGGVLVINEMSRGSLYAHLTFGLLEGWWRYRDGELRLPGCPGLSGSVWRDLLVQEGFNGVLFPAAWAEALGSQVIVARSDGMIRRLTETPVATQSVAATAPRAVAPSPAAGALSLKSRAAAYFKELIGETLKLDPRQIDSRERLEQYGLDSILSVQLTNRLSKQLDNISSTFFFEVPTIEALVAALIEQQPEKLAALVGFREQKPPAAAPGATQDAQPPPASRDAARVHRPVEPEQDAVAVIGLTGRFPMARDLDQFWENLKAGRDCISEVPADRWDGAAYHDATPHTAGKTTCRWGGFLEDVACFDPLFFNISPREAQLMDPQERLFLETVWHLFESVGLTRAALAERHDRRVGVYVGAMYQQMHAFRGDPTTESLLSLTSYASIANRVSQFFDLQGPSMAVDTMCSASLVAVHLACEALLKGETELAVAGGVNLNLHPKKYLGLSAAGMIASDPAERGFAEGGGYLPAEAVGALLLKPLSRAEADGDRILAVIKASSLNHGGAGTGYSVPNPQAQTRLIRANLAKAKIDPATISYVESAANGTALSDAVEFNALRKAFPNDDGFVCAMGSVKTNIGHAEAASGFTQLAKVVLQLHHRQLVPSRKPAVANPKMDWENSPFVFQESLEAWTQPQIEVDGRFTAVPRRAAVSAFGAAGSNAHLILEEYAVQPPVSQAAPEAGGAQLVLLSAKDADRLPLLTGRLADYLAHHPKTSLARLAFTLQCGREAMTHRLALVVDSIPALQQALRRIADGETAAELPVFSGSTATRHRIENLLEGEAGAQFLQTLLRQNDRVKLADLWTQGADVPWHQLYPEPMQPLSLPVYPFQRTRYWFDSSAEPVPAPDKTMPKPNASGDAWLTWIQAEVGRMLALPPARVGADQPLVELGFGSLNGVLLKAELEKRFGLSLPAASLAGFQTAAAIARELSALTPTPPKENATETKPVGEAALPMVVPNPAGRFEPFPLSDIQESYLLGRKLGGVGCHIYLELNAAGVDDPQQPLDLYRLNGAWKTLVAHHDMLRVVFREDGRQQVLPETTPYEFKVLDLRRKTKSAREAALARIRARMAHGVYAPDQWPLFEIRVSICPQHTVIHFSIDELLLDWSGLEMLFRQWNAHYQNPELVRPRPAVSFRDFVLAVKDFAASPRAQRDLAYWLDRVRACARPPGLPMNPCGDLGDSPRERLAETLDPNQWTALKSEAHRLEVSPSALLLALFREVLHAWSDDRGFLLILTYVNRPPLHPDLAQVLAPFISTTLFASEPPRESPAQGVRATQEALWRDLDHDAVSGIRVLRELKKQEGVAQDLSLPVVFTSLLGKETTAAAEPMFAEIGYAVTQTPGVFLDFQVHERDGALVFNWDVVPAAFQAGVVEAMFAAFVGLLRSLAADEARLSDSAWRATLRTEVQAEPAMNLDPRARFEPFPLTDQQQAYAFGRSKFGGNLSSRITMAFDADHLDLDRLNRAWGQVLARHDMLRAVIQPNGMQQVLAEVPDYRIPVADLRDQDGAAIAERLRETAESMQQRIVPLGEWPMFDLHVSRLPEARARLLFSVDMIIADGTSINQLARELFHDYAGDAAPLSAPGAAFRDVVMHGHARKNTAAWRADCDYWRDKFLNMPGGPDLPRLDHGAVTATRGFEQVFTEWTALKAAARERGIHESMVLLGAYAEVLAAWSGGEPFGLVVPCWQRPRYHADVDRIVGDFTAMSWVAVRPDTRTFTAKVQGYQQTVNDDLAHAGVSGLAALRKVTAKRSKQDPLAFPIVYTNMGGATRFDLPEGVRFAGYQSQTSRVHMDNISLETGDALKCKWDVACGVFPDEMVPAMFAGYQRLLAALAAFPEVWAQTEFRDLIRARPGRFRRAGDAIVPAMEEV